jgi:hypothetical protein
MLAQRTIDGMSHGKTSVPVREMLTFFREILKSKVPAVVYFIFNVTFISLIQSVLLFAFSCVPAYTILLSTRFDPDITAADFAYFAVELLLVLSEWVSDGQQWSMFSNLPVTVRPLGPLANVFPRISKRQASVQQGRQTSQGLEPGRPGQGLHYLWFVGI